ncbi:MAG: DUF4411 family protein, partial [Terrimicrobiaceae bacterium]
MSDSPEKYVLDANAFIQARKRFYPFDVVPGYWEALCWHQAAGRVCSVDKISDELKKGNDGLWEWAQISFGAAGFENSALAAVEYGEMAGWVQSQSQFTPAAKAEFMDVADGWLAAFAKKTGRVLVTLEEHKPDAKAKVPLVNVCLAFNVDTISP